MTTVSLYSKHDMQGHSHDYNYFEKLNQIASNMDVEYLFITRGEKRLAFVKIVALSGVCRLVCLGRMFA